jgi:hypothetical protein
MRTGWVAAYLLLGERGSTRAATTVWGHGVEGFQDPGADVEQEVQSPSAGAADHEDQRRQLPGADGNNLDRGQRDQSWASRTKTFRRTGRCRI